jgi:hypothetical protein
VREIGSEAEEKRLSGSLLLFKGESFILTLPFTFSGIGERVALHISTYMNDLRCKPCCT